MEDLNQYECGLFADRETLGEALEYANRLAKASDNPAATLTAVHVVLNTVLRIVREREGVQTALLRRIADYWAGGDVPADLDADMRALLAKVGGEG